MSDKSDITRYLGLCERARAAGHKVELKRVGARWRVSVVTGAGATVAQGHADAIDGAAAIAQQNWREPEAA